MGKKLTHFDADGQAVMVDVGAKPATCRRALARGVVVGGLLLGGAAFALNNVLLPMPPKAHAQTLDRQQYAANTTVRRNKKQKFN